MTGQEVKNWFNIKSDYAYTGYLDDVKMNQMFNNAQYVCIDKRYMTLDQQKNFDELLPLIVTQRVFPVNNNQIYTAPIAIASIVRNIGVCIVTTVFPHNVLGGDQVTFQGLIAPYLNLNGATFTVVSIVSTTVFVFSDGTGLNGTTVLNTGSITTSTLIPDYIHLEAVKCKFQDTQYGVSVISTFGVSPINIRFGAKTKFRSGSQITLSGMTGTPLANGTWYVKQINSTLYELYQDEFFQVPSTGGVTYSSPQGVVNYMWYQYAKPYFSDRKIDQFEKPSVMLPKYEMSERFIKFYPQNHPCTEITLDYIRKPQYNIDVTDTSFDLTLIYPERYLFWLIDQTIYLWSLGLRDQLMKGEFEQEVVQNT